MGNCERGNFQDLLVSEFVSFLVINFLKDNAPKILCTLVKGTLAKSVLEHMLQIYLARATEQAIFNTAKEVGSNWAQVLHYVL